MSQYFQIHPDNPQARLIRHAVDIIRDGGIAVLPTDSSYALACHLDDKRAVERIRQIRDLDKKHNFTLVCRDLSEIATYGRVGNSAYRLLKAKTPGAYTFILRATTIVPRRLQHAKRKTIGIRVPDHPIVRDLLIEHGQPLMGVTLILPGNDFPETDANEIREKLEHQVDLIVDGGHCGVEPTTVIDLTEPVPLVTRHGRGPVDDLE
ncbi:MAG: L-threonylcarbamoyladenylate synthase [Gammaproteobacteria bacterium]|nr:MAG: L-threonylcarbamoyladenylate synthase [Gammaproteobacteria bacterium]